MNMKLEKPGKIKIELWLNLEYTEPIDERYVLDCELDGIKKDVLKAIDSQVDGILSGKYYSVRLKDMERKITFVFE